LSGDEALAGALVALADAREAEASALRTLADAVRGASSSALQDELVDSRGAARHGLSPRAFREAVTRGDLPAYKVGRRFLARAADVRAFIERHPFVPRAPSVRKSVPADGIDAEIHRLLEAGRLRVVKPR
jgi:excisionase family DNA binding protein